MQKWLAVRLYRCQVNSSSFNMSEDEIDIITTAPSTLIFSEITQNHRGAMSNQFLIGES